MTDIEINVRGSHSATVPPERACVYATVSADGPTPEPVLQLVATALAQVTHSLESRLDADNGPVHRYTVDQIRKGAHRPYNQDGRQLPLVHTAAASLTVVFGDAEELAAWVVWAAALPAVAISHIEWTLTEPTRQRTERDTRLEAVRDAARRAQDYADALNLGPVHVRALSDTGLTGPTQPRVMMARAKADSGLPELSLRPENIEVSADINATFVVTGGQ